MRGGMAGLGRRTGSVGRSSLLHSGELSSGSFVREKCRASAFQTQVCLGIVFLLPVLADSKEATCSQMGGTCPVFFSENSASAK